MLDEEEKDSENQNKNGREQTKRRRNTDDRFKIKDGSVYIRFQYSNLQVEIEKGLVKSLKPKKLRKVCFEDPKITSSSYSSYFSRMIDYAKSKDFEN